MGIVEAARVIWASEVVMLRRKIKDASEARTCLAAMARSGLGRAEWARAHGLDARSLNAWRLNLERAQFAHGPVRLVELVAAPPEPQPTRYTVRVNDLAIEVDEHFDGDVLRRLIGVVSSC